jgi:hypothetical protein
MLTYAPQTSTSLACRADRHGDFLGNHGSEGPVPRCRCRQVFLYQEASTFVPVRCCDIYSGRSSSSSSSSAVGAKRKRFEEDVCCRMCIQLLTYADVCLYTPAAAAAAPPAPSASGLRRRTSLALGRGGGHSRGGHALGGKRQLMMRTMRYLSLSLSLSLCLSLCLSPFLSVSLSFSLSLSLSLYFYVYIYTVISGDRLAWLTYADVEYADVC